MSTLITEAERRLLGAMLNDATLNLGDVIDATDFTNPAYGQAFSALAHVREYSYLEGPALSAEVARVAEAPGIDQPTLELLRYNAPIDPDHIASYARMVTDASFARQMRTFSEQVLQSASPDLDPMQLRAQMALMRHTESVLEVLDRPYVPAAPASTIAGVDSSVANEERLVASLLANPEQVRTVVEIVQPCDLEDFRCRTAYEFIATTAWHRDPVSDLDVLYQLERSERLWVNADTERPDYREPDAAFVQRLRDMPTGPTTGTDAARSIAADQANVRQIKEVGPSVFEADLAPNPVMDVAPVAPRADTTAAPRPGMGGGM